MKKILTVLLAVLLVFALAAAAGYGLAWYNSNHIFIQGDPYPLNSRTLDLREKDLTLPEFDAIQAEMPYCQITWNVPFQGAAYPSDTQSLTVTTLAAEDLPFLRTYFPALATLNADGCRDYALLEQFQSENPQCQVTYTVDLGGTSCAPDTAELTLTPADYDYDTLMANLPHLPQVTQVLLKTPEITPDQVNALKEAFPQTEFHCTALILGQEYDTETKELDLSSLTSSDVASTAEKLPLLPGLETVELMPSTGDSPLTPDDVKALMAAAPQAVFHYSFDFFGQTLTTADESVELKNVPIGDENEDKVRLALDLLPNCKRFVLDSCKLSNEVMAKIRDDYRDRTKVVWRVWFGKGSSLTDVDLIRVVGDLLDRNCQDLIYCEDVVCMDLGHNEWLTDTSFIAGMVNLEICVISGSSIKDLTPFANCKKLKFLEIAFCDYLYDATPLAECTNLEMLNIGNTHITDLTPLDDLPLTHLMARMYPSGNCRVPKEEQERFIEQHPDCWSSFTGSQPYGDGWRYDTDNVTLLPYYQQMSDWLLLAIFPRTPNQTGWYFDTYADKK